jgi:hypothetical protein
MGTKSNIIVIQSIMKILFELSLSIILEYTVVEGMDVRLRAFPKSDIFYDKGHMLKKECIYKFII